MYLFLFKTRLCLSIARVCSNIFGGEQGLNISQKIEFELNNEYLFIFLTSFVNIILNTSSQRH